ncbi:hypothetical protein E4U54_004841 [Claviceps lovelessii]|nr:hypothetical protein E4U54_004841 [Claviceps lovelessii]
MKFNTVAGGLLLTALEAFASPIDVVGVPQELTPAHDLEARIVVPSGPAWCCVGGTGTLGDEAAYISTNQEDGTFYGKNGCNWAISIVPGSCEGWQFSFGYCVTSNTNLNPSVQPAEFCKKNGL